MTETIDSQGIRVFVYGTLKKDHPNHDLLSGENVHFLGRCYLEGAFSMLDLQSFPGVIRSDSAVINNRIYGEVYRIDEQTLESLDILEGNGSFYTRHQEWTPWKKAWVYFLPQDFKDGYTVVKGGAWYPTADEKNYIREQEAKKHVRTGT